MIAAIVSRLRIRSEHDSPYALGWGDTSRRSGGAGALQVASRHLVGRVRFVYRGQVPWDWLP